MAVFRPQEFLATQLPLCDVYLDAFQGTAASLGTTTVQLYSQSKLSNFEINILALTGETIAVSATTTDGVTIPAANMVLVNKATGNDVTPTALAVGTYYLKVYQFPQIRSLTFTKSGAVSQGIIACAQAIEKSSSL